MYEHRIVRLFLLAPLACCFGNIAQAAPDAQVHIVGNVTNSTCDIATSTSQLNLGSAKPADLDKSAGTPLAATKKPFTLTLSNCGTPVAGDTVGVNVIGATLSGNSSMFNQNPNAKAGVMLNKQGETTYIANIGYVEIAKAEGTPLAGAFDKQLSLEAGLAGLAGITQGENVIAPITFMVAYN